MAERWFCNACSNEFSKPLRRWTCDDGLTATPVDLCPRCGSGAVEEMEECPTCAGWMQSGDKVCNKCRLRLRGDLQRFARQYSPAALSALDDLLEGNGLEMFT